MKAKVTEQTYITLTDEQCGICLKCKAISYNVEPDAEDYECEGCGSAKVYGVGQCLLIGTLELVATREEENIVI